MKGRPESLMGASGDLATPLLAKIEQQIRITGRLVALVPSDHLDWQPAPRTMRLGELFGHLLEACAGFCAALYTLKPAELEHFAALRKLPVNHPCGGEEARERLQGYLAHIKEGFAILSDADLGRRVPTVFAPQGEAVLTILLANLEHLINHKYQLFFYLKLLGIEVGTAQLYEIQMPQSL